MPTLAAHDHDGRWAVGNDEARALLRSTGAARTFTDEPVDDATLFSILDDARFAPSGGNRQGWRVAVVRDTVLRREIGQFMQAVWDEYAAAARTGVTPFTAVEPAAYSIERDSRLATPSGGASRNPLIERIADIPVVLAVAADLGRIAL